MLISKSRLKKGIKRLMSAPMDLALSGAPVWEYAPPVPGSAAHKKLFSDYLKELKKATTTAKKWWNDMAAAAKDAGDEMQAWQTRPAGPASDPGFVAVMRKYWLACDAVNRTAKPADRVPPEMFLLGWLIDAGRDESVEIIACMPYWPIGLDKDGNWC
jgi:hypothetical protein